MVEWPNREAGSSTTNDGGIVSRLSTTLYECVSFAVADFRFASRTLRKHKTATASILGSLALGVGATSAVFSVVYSVLLSQLPYAQPDRLVALTTFIPQLSGTVQSLPVRAIDFDEYRRSNDVFGSMAAILPTEFDLTGVNEPERLYGSRVSATLFPMLGVSPMIGRSFSAEEDVEGRDRVVLISHGLWTRRFGSDPSIVGRQIQLNKQSYDVIGVMPEHLLFPTDTQFHPLVVFGPRVDVWKPMAFTKNELSDSGGWNWGVIARLRDGVSLSAAQQNIERLSQSIVDRTLTQRPTSGFDLRGELIPLHEVFSGKTRQSLLVLFAAVGLLLGIAAVNITSLQLGYVSSRRQEFATRLALGATRSRIVFQLLTENVLLAFLGSAAGLLLANWGVPLVLSLAPPELTVLRTANINTPVLLFTLFVTLLVTFVAGMTPAFDASRSDLRSALQSRRSGSIPFVSRLRRGLVGIEVAACAALLVLAGLLIHSLEQIRDVRLGFRHEDVVTFDLSLPSSTYTAQKGIAFYRELLARIQTLPGVTSVAAASALPLQRTADTMQVFFESDTREELDRPVVIYRSVTPKYFATMATSIVAGRSFEEQEQTPVVAIGSSLASRMWPAEALPSIIGRRVRLGRVGAPLTIVGVVEDVRTGRPDSEPLPVIYRPDTQRFSPKMTVAVLTNLDPSAVATAVRREVWALDRDLPVGEVSTIGRLIAQSTLHRTFQVLSVSLFSFLALAFTILGIYGVTSYTVARQIPEIGVRISFGAAPRDILMSVLSSAFRPVLVGLAVGLIVGLLVALSLRSLLFGIQPFDPMTVGLVAAVIVLTTLFGCVVPACNAARIDPIKALRSE